MSDHIVGMMWNKNEGDILVDTISSALENVDTLVIADDGSTDNSWDIIQGFNAHHPEIEHIQRNPNRGDPAQRQQLLNVIRDRYKPEDTWVQIIESDIMILETDIRAAIEERAVGDGYVTWALLNAVIPPDRDWDEFDEYPKWSKPIQEIMTYGHWIEEMTYTFRPHEKLHYDPKGPWRPWPKGFSHFSKDSKPFKDYTPLLAHYGYRGPTHVYRKYSPTMKHHSKYVSWDFTSPERVKETMYFFNGTWNSKAHVMSREGWKGRKRFDQ